MVRVVLFFILPSCGGGVIASAMMVGDVLTSPPTRLRKHPPREAEGWQVAEEIQKTLSRFPVGFKQGVFEGGIGGLSGPDDELHGRVIALAGVDSGADKGVALGVIGFGTTGEV